MHTFSSPKQQEENNTKKNQNHQARPTELLTRSHEQDVLSELCFGRTAIFANQLFDFGKLIIKLETLLVGQRVRRLDDLTRNNLLDRKLHFLEVDSRLQNRQVSGAWTTQNERP